MSMEDPSPEGAARPEPRTSMDLARKAEALSGAMGQLVSKLDGADPQIKARFEALRLVFEEHARRARDVASGAAARRAQPMADAWTRARTEGGAGNWRAAFAELAQAALGEARPLWYAGSALVALAPDWDQVGLEEAKALVAPLEQEMMLKAPGYKWEWLATDSAAVVETWARARARAGYP